MNDSAKYTPKTAGSREREVIDSLLLRQDEVLQALNELNGQIEMAVEGLKAERQAEMQESETSVLPMHDASANQPLDDVAQDRAA